MSAVSDARARLFEAAKTAVPSTPWRVFDTSPAQITAPAVWVDSVELGNESSGAAGVIVATFPLYVVVDGTVKAQVVALDELVATLWSAAMDVGNPVSCRSISLDVGGVNLRAQVMRVDVFLAVQTFCAPLLTSTGGI